MGEGEATFPLCLVSLMKASTPGPSLHSRRAWAMTEARRQGRWGIGYLRSPKALAYHISFCLVVVLLLFFTFKDSTRIQNCCVHTSPECKDLLLFFSVIHSINSYQGFSPGSVFFYFYLLCIYLLNFWLQWVCSCMVV